MTTRKQLATKEYSDIEAQVSNERQPRSVEENKRVLLHASKFHQGPLPAPDDLMKYERICPGAAERILKMAENEQKTINKLKLKEFRSSRLGLIFGFISLFFMLVITALSVLCGESWVAGVLIAVVSGCSILISRKK